MKKSLLFILVLLLSTKLFSQNYYGISFEGNGLYEYHPDHKLYIDTISNPNNIWQIGAPQKTNLSAAVSIPNVIITDSVNYYPVNDTSSFILSHVADLGFAMPANVIISGMYNVNSDTLTDYGMIEFSPDNGVTWIDLNDTTYSDYVYWFNSGWGSQGPVLSGNSTGWKPFEAMIQDLGPFFNIQYGDTVMWKFTFISDGIQTNKDGLMFDSLFIWDVPPIGIRDISENAEINFYPNPSSSVINFEFENIAQEHLIQIYDCRGRIVNQEAISASINKVSIDIKNYPAGIYYFRLMNEGQTDISSGKFIKTE